MNIYNRAAFVDRNFLDQAEGWSAPPQRRLDPARPLAADTPLTGSDLLELFESQIISRHLDLMSRELRGRDASFYTIGSSGHEGNVALGRLTRETDPAFLHYRSGAFVVERYRHQPQLNAIDDILLSMVASADDGISGGRHKVWGSVPLWILPQTSTIASHLPRAVGMAIGLRRALKMGVQPPVPPDSVIVCSFGDASVNHSTAVGALNAAARAVYQQLACPILFVCEDNGMGISVQTPAGWVENTFSQRPGIKYFKSDGLDVVDAHRVAGEALNYCRRQARPVFLHMNCVRLMGHAGSDVELEYRTTEEVTATEARDPLLATARTVMENGLLSAGGVRDLYLDVRRRVAESAERAIRRPQLTTRSQVIAPLAPYSRQAVEDEARRHDFQDSRLTAFGGAGKLPENSPPRALAGQINNALTDLMCKYPEAIVFGEDVAQKGGVYNVTAGLFNRFSKSRVFNTILDEQMILGLAQGLAYCGLLPLPEIQYLAYFHNACDQIRGEACSTQFFSNGQYRNPMVLRIAGLAYQKGFGGHFHNDNSVAALRDIPGLILACPSRGDDAVGMLRTCAALARVDGRVAAFLEPIALYHVKDLHAPRDEQWLFPYPAATVSVPLGRGRVYHEDACDLLIVTYGNGVRMSLRAARILQQEQQIHVRVLDLRWLNPLDTDMILCHARECGKVLVVDEGRRTGGISEAIMATIAEGSDRHITVRRIAGEDTYIPLGPAANLVLPSEEQIIQVARAMTGQP